MESKRRSTGLDERVVVIGGGISGLGAAWRLVQRGVGADVLEAAPILGGLAATHADAGSFLDVGPHSLFSDDAATLEALLGLFVRPPPTRPRTVKFLYEGRLIDYPLTARGALLQMGLGSGLRAAVSLVKGRMRPRARAGRGERTVEEWALESFGEHLYRSFFKPYTEQFWKVPCTELAAEAIPTHTRMSFANTLRLLLRRRTSAGGESLIEREALPTYYPEAGFSQIAEQMALRVVAAGGTVQTGCRATRIEPIPGGGARVHVRRGAERGEVVGRRVISTVPLPLLVEMLRPAPPAPVRLAAANLDYRSLVVLGMVTRRAELLGCGYVYQLNRPYNRVFEMTAFSPRACPPGRSLIAVEIPCHRGGLAWGASAETLFDSCIGSLAKDGVLGPGDVERLMVVRASHAYPIYRVGWRAHLERALGHVASLGYLTTLGRSGEFRYMDIDHCLRRAFDRVDGLLA